MSKEFKHKRDEKKKPVLSLKERREKKHEKHRQRSEHAADSGFAESPEA